MIYRCLFVARSCRWHLEAVKLHDAVLVSSGTERIGRKVAIGSKERYAQEGYALEGVLDELDVLYK